nr:PHP domain-containing protein [uncultured Halomonas sp.]
MMPLPDRLEAVSGLDLHMHSTASDGALAPAALVALCHSRGVTHMALTDHDTLAGIDEASAEAEQFGIRLLPAAELSAQWRGMTIHVVALLPTGPSVEMDDALATQAEARVARSKEIARRLEAVGLENALTRAREQAGSERPLGRPDFARALVEAGVVPDMATAFKKYLGAGKRGDVKAHWPYLGDVIDWTRQSSGVAVLAHPLRYGLTRRKRGLLLDSFVEAGGEAAELVSGFQNADITRDLARQLGERGLYGSLGSDFHFPGGHLAPGSMSPVSRCDVLPVWHHPLMRDFAG